MKANRIYLILIIILVGVVGFLVFLLFMGDSGKYCVPITKEKIFNPASSVNKDSIRRMDSLNNRNK